MPYRVAPGAARDSQDGHYHGTVTTTVEEQEQPVVVPSQWKVGAALDRLRFPQYGGDWETLMGALYGEGYQACMPRSDSPLTAEDMTRESFSSSSCPFTSRLANVAMYSGRARAAEPRLRPGPPWAVSADASDDPNDAGNPSDPSDGRRRHEDRGVLTDDRAPHPRHGGAQRARPPAERDAPEHAAAVQARCRRGVRVLQAAQDSVRGPEGGRRGGAVWVSPRAFLFSLGGSSLSSFLSAAPARSSLSKLFSGRTG